MRKARLVALACCSLACISLPERVNAQFFAQSYAIVIGIDHYAAPKWPTLGYAVKDAKAMAALLESQGFTVIRLYESQAKKQAILSAMQDYLAPRLGPGDRVLVFFAGHGQTETLGGQKRGYIVPYDGDQSSTLISMAELQEQSSLMGNAKHELFIMDSCYGGLLAVVRDSVVDPHVPHYLQVVTERIARQVLTAGGEDQEVVDGGPKGHSVFMDALLEGLQDGLADSNGDGYITFQELVAYVTPRASNAYQTPGVGVLPGHQEGEFLFLNPKGPGRPVSEIPVPANAERRNGLSVATAEQHLALGNSRWPIGDFDGAITEYREAIRLKPDYTEAHEALGAALSWKGDWDGEIREEREAIRLKPDYAEAHMSLGVALGWKTDLDGEIREEREAIRLKPDYPEAHRELGAALFKKGDLDDAITEEREAIRLKPDYAEAHEQLGGALVNKGDLDGGITEEREAIHLKPEYPDAHRDLGVALAWKADLDGAIAQYREAIRLKPNYAEAHMSLGAALVMKGDWDGAITEEQDAISLKSDYAEAHQALGVALGWKADRDGAIREEREAISLKPDYPDAHRELGMALGWKGDWDGEIREEREAISLNPDDADAHNALGIGLEQKGETQSALAEYRRALKLKPGLADAQSRYDNLLKQTNSPPK